MADGQVGYEGSIIIGGVTAGKVRDTSMDMDATAVDVTAKDSAGWRCFVQGLKSFSGTGGQIFVASTSGLQAIRAAYIAGSEVTIRLIDGSGNGFSGSAIITRLSFGQPLDDAMVLDFDYQGTDALTVVGEVS